MSVNKLRRISISVFPPLLSFIKYMTVFETPTMSDILKGGVVTLFMILIIYMCFPVGQRVERGSLIWLSWMAVAITLLSSGWLLSNARFL